MSHFYSNGNEYDIPAKLRGSPKTRIDYNFVLKHSLIPSQQIKLLFNLKQKFGRGCFNWLGAFLKDRSIFDISKSSSFYFRGI